MINQWPTWWSITAQSWKHAAAQRNLNVTLCEPCCYKELRHKYTYVLHSELPQNHSVPNLFHVAHGRRHVALALEPLRWRPGHLRHWVMWPDIAARFFFSCCFTGVGILGVALLPPIDRHYLTSIFFSWILLTLNIQIPFFSSSTYIYILHINSLSPSWSTDSLQDYHVHFKHITQFVAG